MYIGTGVAQKLPMNYLELIEGHFKRGAILVFLLRIPPPLCFSADETFNDYVNMGGKRTYAERGAKRVSIVAADDKRGVTLLVTTKMDGKLSE